MTLDDLKKIDSDASSAKHRRDELRAAAQFLAARRTNEQGCTFEAVMQAIGRYSYGAQDVAKEALMRVLDEQISDALRIAELRLEARARAAGAKHRVLTEQVRSFFDEEAQS
ncbi:hypothetical protein CAL14_08320 [Bordetella genomosp. 9]|uniref:hypothetical protein n=1 Tax=Bordetella genomosp. 9 TaxID=1416803 RepID=UPI000A297BC1|nr:hypothetical protein [Bordetella genomosp. 9]ARP90288.1 hypothetical protein CAL14_08320 [Bordetella genomosp. 9]